MLETLIILIVKVLIVGLVLNILIDELNKK
jgi:hypothetical protein